MKSSFHLIAMILSTVLASVSPLAAYAQDNTVNTATLSKSYIGELVEPIALYPDQLLQTILPAATFPDQIVDAGLLIKTADDAKLIRDQSWDNSVKVVATYPGILQMMFKDMIWTSDLGRAFLNQNEELLSAIQLKRAAAKSHGNLKSDTHQVVKTEKTESGQTVIIVQSANPEVIYVPQSSPTVYTQPSAASSVLVPLATFGIGMALGSAMSNNHNDHYYYSGGYYGPGPGMWYNNNSYNQWSNNRRAAWEDYNDRAWDKQDHRQDMASSSQEFRQEMIREGKTPVNQARRDQVQQQAQQHRGSFSKNHPDAASKAQNRPQQADLQARREQANAAMKSHGFDSSSTQRAELKQRSAERVSNRASSAGAIGGSFGDRASVYRASSRGSFSRGGGGGFQGRRR